MHLLSTREDPLLLTFNTQFTYATTKLVSSEDLVSTWCHVRFEFQNEHGDQLTDEVPERLKVSVMGEGYSSEFLAGRSQPRSQGFSLPTRTEKPWERGWVRMCSSVLQALTLFQTVICNFLITFSDLAPGLKTTLSSE